MNIKEIRRKNLLALQDEYLLSFQGGKAGFADKIGMPPSQLSQLTSEKGTKNIGDIIARRIESKLGLHRGWMDSLNSVQLEIPDVRSGTSNRLIEKPQPTNSNPASDNAEQTYKIDLLDVEFSCGGGRLNTGCINVIQSIELDPKEARQMFGNRDPSTLKIVTAVGDSMIGSISPGELVVIDIATRNFIGDGIYSFIYGESFHIKRLQLLKDRMMVISDNTAYDRWDITDQDEDMFHIQGIVVGKWRMDYTRLG